MAGAGLLVRRNNQLDGLKRRWRPERRHRSVGVPDAGDWAYQLNSARKRSARARNEPDDSAITSLTKARAPSVSPMA